MLSFFSVSFSGQKKSERIDRIYFIEKENVKNQVQMNSIANRLQRSLMDETTRIELHVSKVCLVCLFVFNLIHNSNCKQYIGGKGKSFVSRSSNTNLDCTLMRFSEWPKMSMKTISNTKSMTEQSARAGIESLVETWITKM